MVDTDRFSKTNEDRSPVHILFTQTLQQYLGVRGCTLPLSANDVIVSLVWLCVQCARVQCASPIRYAVPALNLV